MENFDLSRDIPNLMTYPLSNGNILKAERRDPYGLWFLNLDKGPMPEAFQGAYSTIEKVKEAILAYTRSRELTLGAPPPRPQIEYKTPKAV